MAYADNRTTSITLADRFFAFVAEFNEAAAKRKLVRTTYNELTNLSNRELADLGINRSMIKSIALEASKK